MKFKLVMCVVFCFFAYVGVCPAESNILTPSSASMVIAKDGYVCAVFDDTLMEINSKTEDFFTMKIPVKVELLLARPKRKWWVVGVDNMLYSVDMNKRKVQKVYLDADGEPTGYKFKNNRIFRVDYQYAYDVGRTNLAHWNFDFSVRQGKVYLVTKLLGMKLTLDELLTPYDYKGIKGSFKQVSDYFKENLAMEDDSPRDIPDFFKEFLCQGAIYTLFDDKGKKWHYCEHITMEGDVWYIDLLRASDSKLFQIDIHLNADSAAQLAISGTNFYRSGPNGVVKINWMTGETSVFYIPTAVHGFEEHTADIPLLRTTIKDCVKFENVRLCLGELTTMDPATKNGFLLIQNKDSNWNYEPIECVSAGQISRYKNKAVFSCGMDCDEGGCGGGALFSYDIDAATITVKNNQLSSEGFIIKDGVIIADVLSESDDHVSRCSVNMDTLSLNQCSTLSEGEERLPETVQHSVHIPYQPGKFIKKKMKKSARLVDNP